MLTIAICKIPICMRLLRLAPKLDELSSVGYFRVVVQMFEFIMVRCSLRCDWDHSALSLNRLMAGGTLGGMHLVDDRRIVVRCVFEMCEVRVVFLALALTSVCALSDSTNMQGFDGASWLRRVPAGSTPLDRNVSVTPFTQQYMSSMYWSLTTLMKTPWVGPDTVAEKIYASLMVVLGATLFAMLLGNVTAMINTYNKRHSELRDQLTTLHTFATFRRVPAGLQRKMFAYVDAYWNMTAGLDHASILNTLPPRLRGSVLLAIHGSLLRECPMLRQCSEECAKTLLLKAKPQVTLQKEDLLVRGMPDQTNLMRPLSFQMLRHASTFNAGSSHPPSHICLLLGAGTAVH